MIDSVKRKTLKFLAVATGTIATLQKTQLNK